jgi:hypothetical protein
MIEDHCMVYNRNSQNDKNMDELCNRNNKEVSTFKEKK